LGISSVSRDGGSAEKIGCGKAKLPHPILYPHHIHHFTVSGIILSRLLFYRGFRPWSPGDRKKKASRCFDIAKSLPYNATVIGL
jgi:hypothetical protein